MFLFHCRWLVSLGIDYAQKTEGLIKGVTELMCRIGSYVEGIEEVQFVLILSAQHLTLSLYPYNDMLMPVFCA